MITEIENKQLLLHCPLRGKPVGAKVPVKVDSEGTILDSYWRNRLKDAQIDNCCELISTKEKGGK